MSGLRRAPRACTITATIWRLAISTDLPLTTTFRNAGYRVTGAGKIYHGRYERDSEWDDYQHSRGQPAEQEPVTARRCAVRSGRRARVAMGRL